MAQKQTSKRRAINYGQVLMWTAVFVSMPRWAGAFIVADAQALPVWVDAMLNYLSILSGFGMGILEVVATAYMLDAWGKMRPRKTWNAKRVDHRWKVLTGFIVGLFVLMPFILAPYLVARMNGLTISQALGGNGVVSYLWSLAVVISPAFIVGGVAFANDGMMPAREPAESKAKPAQSKPKAIESKPEPAPPVFQCEDCQQKYGTVQALNAHQRWCAKKKPAISINGAFE